MAKTEHQCELDGCEEMAVSSCDNCDRWFCEEHGTRGGDRVIREVLTAVPAMCERCRG